VRRWLGVVRTQFVVLGVSLLVCELALQLLGPLTRVGALLGKRPAVPPIAVPDERLGARGNPEHQDHDARGYRNLNALASADVVALGDSQTYGTSVRREEAWPAALARRTGLSVYNMAFAGYGPGHRALQLPEALALKPAAVAEAFYFGNDLFDAFSLGRKGPVPPGLDYLAQRAAALEREETLEQKATRFFDRGRTEHPPSEARHTVRRWLSKNMMLYAFLREARNSITGPPPLLSRNFERAVASLTATDRLYVSIVDGPDWRTILTARYRHIVLNQRDPRILLGFELAAAALESMAAQCRSAGVDFVVVLIPTKESVFWPRIRTPKAHAELEELVVDETALRARLVQRLKGAGVEVIDVLPALRAAAAQPYLQDADGHPSPAGHAIIAERLADWVVEHATPTRRGIAGSATTRHSRPAADTFGRASELHPG
jgi:SGNH hydrolase-like domain, acetyltransferase AlgX